MFAENLKTLRKAKGLSQEELAIRLNVVRQTISKWEKGLSVPDADLLIQIAEILEVPVTELLGAKIENEREIGAVAEQLSRINEQLAIQNRRSRRIWQGVVIVLVAFALISVLSVALSIAAYLPYQEGVTSVVESDVSATHPTLPVPVMVEGDLWIGFYYSEDGMSWVRIEENGSFKFNRHSAMSYIPSGEYSVSDEILTLKALDDEEYSFIIKNNGLELELESTYIEDILEEVMLFVFKVEPRD